jgi:hypothetical protein
MHNKLETEVFFGKTYWAVSSRYVECSYYIRLLAVGIPHYIRLKVVCSWCNQNKCAGQNNFNTKPFKRSIISGLVTAISGVYFAEVRRASANSSLAMVQLTPYQLVLKISWDNKRLASSVFTIRQRNKSAGGKSG